MLPSYLPIPGMPPKPLPAPGATEIKNITKWNTHAFMSAQHTKYIYFYQHEEHDWKRLFNSLNGLGYRNYMITMFLNNDKHF